MEVARQSAGVVSRNMEPKRHLLHGHIEVMRQLQWIDGGDGVLALHTSSVGKGERTDVLAGNLSVGFTVRLFFEWTMNIGMLNCTPDPPVGSLAVGINAVGYIPSGDLLPGRTAQQFSPRPYCTIEVDTAAARGLRRAAGPPSHLRRLERRFVLIDLGLCLQEGGTISHQFRRNLPLAVTHGDGVVGENLSQSNTRSHERIHSRGIAFSHYHDFGDLE